MIDKNKLIFIRQFVQIIKILLTLKNKYDIIKMRKSYEISRCFATIVRPLYGVLRYSLNATFIEKESRAIYSLLFYI